MTYFSYEDESYEEYQEYLVDYYGEAPQETYQEPVYQYYYPSRPKYNQAISKYEDSTPKYDYSQGDYYVNYHRCQDSRMHNSVEYQSQEEGLGNTTLGYTTIVDEGENQKIAKLGEDDEVTTTMDETTSSTPMIPTFLYKNLATRTQGKKKRPMKKPNSKRALTKSFDHVKLGKLDEVSEMSSARQKSLVTQETMSPETPVKLVQTSDPSHSESKLQVPQEQKDKLAEKPIEMSCNLDRKPTSGNSKYYSLGNVNETDNANPVKSDEMIAWKNRSMPDTSATSSMCLDTTNEFKPSTLSTDCTCVTIDSEEYKEFVKQINKIPQMKIQQQSSSSDNIVRSESAPPIQIGALLKTVYDANNSCRKRSESKELTLETRGDFKSEPMPGGRECIRSRRCSYKKRQAYVNPLVEVPLHSPLKALFGFTSFGQQKKHVKRRDDSPVRKRSFLAKMFRYLITVIGCVQSVAYKYALRYILFI